MSLSSINTAHRTEVFAIADACFDNNSVDDFKNIIKSTEGIVGQKMSVCGIGIGDRRAMTAISSMNIGFPEAFIEKIINPSGCVKLPLFDLWLENQSPQILEVNSNISILSTSDIALYKKYSVYNFISHGVLDFGQHYASYFGFANISRKIDAYHIALIKMLVPYLHIAYTRLPLVKKHLISTTFNVSPSVSGVSDDNRRFLTPKEHQVLSMLLEGRSNNDIAEALNISKFTVKTHVQRIIKKLNATSRQHAVAIALELKLISL